MSGRKKERKRERREERSTKGVDDDNDDDDVSIEKQINFFRLFFSSVAHSLQAIYSPSRHFVQHVVAERQAGVGFQRGEGLGPARGESHLGDGQDFRRVREELRELRGGSHD